MLKKTRWSVTRLLLEKLKRATYDRSSHLGKVILRQVLAADPARVHDVRGGGQAAALQTAGVVDDYVVIAHAAVPPPACSRRGGRGVRAAFWRVVHDPVKHRDHLQRL